MKKATSAGGIFVKRENGKYFLLLLKYPEYGDFGFLKGHIEKGETIEQAALREIKEEAGLEQVIIVKKLGEVVREAKENNGESVMKTIHLFLMRSNDFNHRSSEENYEWIEYNEAIKKMAFREEAAFLKRHKEKIIVD